MSPSSIDLNKSVKGQLGSLQSNAGGKAAGKTGTLSLSSGTSGASPTDKITDTIGIAIGAMNKKAEDLQNVLDAVDKSLTVLASARKGVEDVIGKIETIGGYTVRARDLIKATGAEANEARLKELEQKFAAGMEDITKYVENAGNKGVNLLMGETLETVFDKTGKSVIKTEGLKLTAEAMGFRTPDFSSAFKVQDSRIDVLNALDLAVTLRNQISADTAIIQSRQEFSNAAMTSLSEGAEHIGSTDLSDEAANLMALQLRQQLGEDDTQSLATEQQRYILQQF